MKTIIISSEREKAYAISLIEEMPVDGSHTVETKKTDISATAKQRGLHWLWSGEVAASGLGRDDTKEGVHLTAKWKYVRPILLRDSITFGAIYEGFSEMIEQIDVPRDKLWREFCRDYISTEKLTQKQRAEAMSEFQRYWTGKGVALTDPSLQGLDRNLGCNPCEDKDNIKGTPTQ